MVDYLKRLKPEIGVTSCEHHQDHDDFHDKQAGGYTKILFPQTIQI